MWASSSADPQWEVTARIARYAYDRLTNPVYGIAAGAFTVWCLAAVEGSLHLRPPSSSRQHLQQQPQIPSSYLRLRFILRYATSNVAPSLIWGTQPPADLVASSRFLRSSGMNAQQHFYSSVESSCNMPSQRSVYIRLLCSLRGAVAGTVLLSNVIGLTALWQQASHDYAERIVQGREPPLLYDHPHYKHSSSTSTSSSSSTNRASTQPPHNQGRTIRLCGERSDVTKLTLAQHGVGAVWPIFEDPNQVQDLVQMYGGFRPATNSKLWPSSNRSSSSSSSSVAPMARRPIYWHVKNGAYSKKSSWSGMTIPESWLYTVNDKMLLYLEADATVGDESAMALRQHGSVDEGTSKDRAPRREQVTHRWWWNGFGRSSASEPEDSVSSLGLDLEIKEVAQGFRCLSRLVTESSNTNDTKHGAAPVQVVRVLLIDPTIIVESGGGRRETIRDVVRELGLADLVVDARESILSAKLNWLKQYTEAASNERPAPSPQPVILETPSKEWLASIRAELRKYGYDVIDRAEVDFTEYRRLGKSMPPFLVYERSGADTVHTIQQYIQQGIVQDPSQVCALLTSPDGMDEVVALNKALSNEGRSTVGYICSSFIHKSALDWVRHQCLRGVPLEQIQKELDEGRAQGSSSC